ncbi:RNA polymerase sigma factor [Denitrobaculum tricleocarpae]|uniref:RNA polymerase sigma factor n=1 Tax=Denitrobaculum tricleocarpae TaxID=2591009 RepID=UPI001FEB0C9B|nr:RNA polymerase sigma factor [Denitrobaculum tricleocarpae]
MDQRERLESYRDRLYGYAISLSQDPDLSRDLVQDCALKALTAKKVPQDEPAFRAWLFRILRNAFLDHLRAADRLADFTFDDSDDLDPGVWSAEERMVDAVTVRVALAAMPAGQRDILALIDIAGLRYAEAATLLDVPVGTVMSRVSRARQALLLRISGSNVTPLKSAVRSAVNSSQGGRRR